MEFFYMYGVVNMNSYSRHAMVLVFLASGIMNASESKAPIPFDQQDVRVQMHTPTTMAQKLSDLRLLGTINHEGSELVEGLASQKRRPASVVQFVSSFHDYMLIAAAAEPNQFGCRKNGQMFRITNPEINATCIQALVVMVLVGHDPRAVSVLEKSNLLFDGKYTELEGYELLTPNGLRQRAQSPFRPIVE